MIKSSKAYLPLTSINIVLKVSFAKFTRSDSWAFLKNTKTVASSYNAVTKNCLEVKFTNILIKLHFCYANYFVNWIASLNFRFLTICDKISTNSAVTYESQRIHDISTKIHFCTLVERPKLTPLLDPLPVLRLSSLLFLRALSCYTVPSLLFAVFWE